MDTLDFTVYRYLSPNGEARFWAGRRIIDPTIPAREIAEKVGISENGVRSRLRRLSEQGYLRGRAVTPNPSLFGVRVSVVELPVKGSEEVERIYRDLSLVDGVIFARDTLDEGNRAIGAYFVSEGDSSTARRAALLRRLASTGEPRPAATYSIPPSERELSPLDWRVLDVLFQHPEAEVAEIARLARISVKTAARRHHELLDSRALWYTHSPNSEEFPLALVQVDVPRPESRDAVSAEIVRATPSWMPVAQDGLGLEPEAARKVVAGLVPADAPTLLERTVRKLLEMPGVGRVRRTFALGSRSYPGWFSERIAQRAPART